MAILKQRLHRKNAGGTYDTIHLETSADLVLMSDGTKLSNKIGTIEANISKLDGGSAQHDSILKELFYFKVYRNPNDEIASTLTSTSAVGDVVVFDAKLWRVVYIADGIQYLLSYYVLYEVIFNSDAKNATYKGSNIAAECVSFANTHECGCS